MDTIESMGVRRRRRHSAEFKAKVLAACRQPGASRAGVALAHSINANLLRKWLAQAEKGQPRTLEPSKRVIAPSESFVALPLARQVREGPPIRIEVHRGSLAVSVQWPSSAISECAIWLRELLK